MDLAVIEAFAEDGWWMERWSVRGGECIQLVFDGLDDYYIPLLTLSTTSLEYKPQDSGLQTPTRKPPSIEATNSHTKRNTQHNRKP